MEFYEDEQGRAPVEEFLNALPERHLGKVLQVLQLLEDYGPSLPFPFSSQVEGRLRELRVHYGNTHYRILYYSDIDRVFVLLHGFRKRTRRIPKRAKETAWKRMEEDIQRKEKQYEKKTKK